MDSVSSMGIIQKMSQMIRRPPHTPISQPIVVRTPPPASIGHQRAKEKKISPSLLIRSMRFLRDTWFNLLALMFYFLLYHLKWFVWKFIIGMDSVSSMGIIQKKYKSQNVRCTGKRRHKVGIVTFFNS